MQSQTLDFRLRGLRYVDAKSIYVNKEICFHESRTGPRGCGGAKIVWSGSLGGIHRNGPDYPLPATKRYWKVKDDIDSTIIARSGYDFVVTNTGDKSSRMFFRYEHGILAMKGSAGMLEIRYDRIHDAIVAFTPGFPVEIVLPRVK